MLEAAQDMVGTLTIPHSINPNRATFRNILQCKFTRPIKEPFRISLTYFIKLNWA